MELLRPELHNLEWEKGGKEIAEAHIDDEVLLRCDVKDIPDGERVRFCIHERGEGKGRLVEELAGEVKDGAVQVPWKVFCKSGRGSNVAKEIAERGWAELGYYFTVEYDRAESKSSGVMEVKGLLDYDLIDDKTDALKIDEEYALLTYENEAISAKTDENGYIKLDSLKLGEFIILNEEGCL